MALCPGAALFRAVDRFSAGECYGDGGRGAGGGVDYALGRGFVHCSGGGGDCGESLGRSDYAKGD